MIKTVVSCLSEVGFDATYEQKKSLTKKRLLPYIIKGMVGLVCGIALLTLSLLGITLPLIVMYSLIAVVSLLTLYFTLWELKKPPP